MLRREIVMKAIKNLYSKEKRIMKQSFKRLMAICLMVALLGTLVLQAAPIAQAVDYLTTLPQLHYGDYGTVNIVHDQGNCYSMQGVATDADYTYCAKIGSNDAVACIVRLAKADGAKTIMTNAANGGYYFYNLGHANALDIVKINGVQQMFVTGGANLVRLTMSGTTLTTAGTYTFTYNGATTNTTAVQIMSASSKEVKVITKGGKSLYTGTLDPTASSGNIELTHLCNLDVANIRLKGEIQDYSTYVQQGFDYRDGKVFVPLSGNAYVETINQSIVAVYDVEGASGTVYNDPTLSFRIISGQYAGLFEIEDVEVCDFDGKLYFSSNRRKTESDTNYDGVSFFNGYVYDPSMSTTGPADYRWETVNNQWVTVTDGGNTFNNPIRIGGYMTDNTMAESVYHMSRGVVLKHDKPWVVEWKSSGSFAGGAMMLHGGRTSTTVDAPYIFRFQNSTFISMGYYDGTQHNNYGVKLSDHGINGLEEHVYRLTNKIDPDGYNLVYLSVDGKQLGAMNNYYIGLSDQNKKIDWVTGKDFTFCYQGTFDNPLNQCQLDYLQVWADGVPAAPSNIYRWESKNDNLTSVTGGNYTENVPTIYNGSVSGSTYTSACFRLDKAVKLMHDRQWSIEWQSEGNTSSVFLLSAAEGGRNPNAPFLFRYHTNLIFLGAHDGTRHANCGINLDDYGIDGTEKHTYRLSNKVASDGSNMVYLYVDGSQIGPMNNSYNGTTNLNTTSDWLNGKDLVFDYVGNRAYPMGGTYQYLQVLEDQCNHSFSSWKTTAATCTKAGYKTRSCTLCGMAERQELPALGHNYQVTVQNATCTTYAKYTYTCANCSDTYTLDASDMAGTWLDAIPSGMDASLFESQTQYRYSDYETKTSYETSMAGYTQASSQWVKASTGSVTYVPTWASGFDTASSVYTQYNKSKVTASETATAKTVIDSDQRVGYLWYHWCTTSKSTSWAYETSTYNIFHTYYGTTAPSNYECDTYDYSYYTNHSSCSNSGWWFPIDVYRQDYTTYKKQFTYERWTDFTEWSGTAVTASATRKVETRTGYRLKGAELASHSYTTKVTAPTCTAKGYTTYTCSVCGYSYKGNEKAALGHSYTSKVTTAAGCTSTGVKTYTCKTCGHKYTETIPAAGHSYTSKVTAPTCTAKGYTTYTCACGYSYTADEKAALGHSLDNGVCTRCGFTDPDYVEPVVQPTLTLKSPSLEFKDMVTVNAMFTAENTEDVVEMGMVTYDEKVAAVSVDTADHVIPGTTYDVNTGRYVASSQGIHAKNLGDTVYMACYAKLTDGSYTYTKLAPYSPAQYAASQLKNSSNMKLKQLCAAMLNYGAEAQRFFGYNVENLANASLTEAQKALPESYRGDMVNAVPAASAAKQGVFANNKGFSTRYPAISFEGAFCINYFFKPKYTPVDGITLYYWYEADYTAADVLTAQNASGSMKLELQDSGEYSGDILGISAKSLSEAVYVAAVYSDGTTTWTSGVLGYSIGAYCSSQSAKGAAVAALAEATAVYGYQAKQYFG